VDLFKILDRVSSLLENNAWVCKKAVKEVTT